MVIVLSLSLSCHSCSRFIESGCQTKSRWSTIPHIPHPQLLGFFWWLQNSILTQPLSLAEIFPNLLRLHEILSAQQATRQVISTLPHRQTSPEAPHPISILAIMNSYGFFDDIKDGVRARVLLPFPWNFPEWKMISVRFMKQNTCCRPPTFSCKSTSFFLFRKWIWPHATRSLIPPINNQLQYGSDWFQINP